MSSRALTPSGHYRCSLNEALGFEAEESSTEPKLVLSPGQWHVPCRQDANDALCGCQATVAACEDVLRFALRKHRAHMGSITILDLVLLDCELVIKATRTLVEFFVASMPTAAQSAGIVMTTPPHSVRAIPADSAAIVSSSSVQLVASIQALLGKANLCSNLTFNNFRDAASDSSITASESALQTYVAELQESVAKVSANAVLLLQGVQNNSGDMVKTAVADIFDSSVFTCCNVGRLSLLTGMRLDSGTAEQISAKLSRAAARGVGAVLTRSMDDALLSLRGSLCSLKTVRQVRPKDQDVSACEHLLQLLADLLSYLKGLVVNASDKARETAAQSYGTQQDASGGVCVAWQADDFQPASTDAILECWRASEHYGKWIAALSLLKEALGALVKPLLRPGCEYDRDGMVDGTEIVRQALGLLVEGLPSCPAAIPVPDLLRRIDLQILALIPESKTVPAMAMQAPSRTVLSHLSGAGAKRRASCMSVVTVSKLAAIFEK